MEPDDIQPQTDPRPTVHLIYSPERDVFHEYVKSKHCTDEHPHLIVDRKHDDTAWSYFHQQNRITDKAKAVRESMRGIERILAMHRRYVKTYHEAIKGSKAQLAATEAKALEWEAAR